MISFLLLAISFVPFSPQPGAPPDSVSLEYCYRKAKANYPTAKNIALQKKISALNVRIARSGYFPQISAKGQATYQSEVTSVSLPGDQGPPPPPKDQYEASIHAVETIFNDGKIGKQEAFRRAQGAKARASTKVKLHQIRAQVNQVYYGILLSRQQARTIDLKIEDLTKRLKTVKSRVKNGVLLPGQQYVLQAELARSRKDSATTQSNIKAGYKILSELIGVTVTPVTGLKLPKVAIDYRSMQPQRPEYIQFKKAQTVLEQQQKLAQTQKWPRISAFGTGSYGRPGLNFLNSEFHYYYIVGLQLNWSLFGAINGGRQAQALKVQQQKVVQNRRAFDRQLQSRLDRIGENIASIRENMKRDRKIVKLQRKIVRQNANQLKNGVITSTEYVTALRRANQAELSLFISEVQLSQAQTNYITTLGIPPQIKTTKRIYEH